MNDTLVDLKNVSKKFNDKEVALEELSATFPKGQIIGLVGPDGAGKTTLLRLMAGLLLPTTGTITVAGRYDTIGDATFLRSVIGYMPQKFGLYEDLTVIENLTLYADLHGVIGDARTAAFTRLFHFTALEPFKNRLAAALSGGMKQKLGLACTLLSKPILLLLDEPSVGVDPISRRELWKMVYDLVDEGITVVWSTSYLDEAERCHSVLLLHEGHLLYRGAPKQLTERFREDTTSVTGRAPRFEDAFLAILGGGPKGPSLLAEAFPQQPLHGNSVVEAQGLTKSFGSFTAADDITFKIHQGEIFGLLGPNGAGKSTTFKMMCGLLTPTQGHAFVQGLDLQRAPSEARAQIGYMAQKFSLYGNLSVRQNLEFFAGIYNLRGREKRSAIEQMIDIFNLQPYLNSNAELLPLGFKQRLALSCSLMHRPAVLFLDEPTSGVDPITRMEFWNHIKGLVEKGVTIMVTTHFMDEAEYCDQIALIYRSRMIKMGTPEALKAAAKSDENPNPTLEDAFIHLIEHYDATKVS